MRYRCRQAEVTASGRIDLDGSQFVLVSIAGEAQVVPQRAFDALFALIEEGGAAPPVATPRPRPAARPTSKPAKNDSGMTTSEAVLAVVKEAVRTKAETIDHVCDRLGLSRVDKAARDRVYQCIWTMCKSGKLVVKDDPKTQLPGLHLAGGPA